MKQYALILLTFTVLVGCTPAGDHGNNVILGFENVQVSCPVYDHKPRGTGTQGCYVIEQSLTHKGEE